MINEQGNITAPGLEEARARFHQGRERRLHGSEQEAVVTLRRAILLYAAADTGEDENRESLEYRALCRERADACQEFADCLYALEQYAEAANIYQEATDLYARLESQEDQKQSRDCAHKAVTTVSALRARPWERLQLLIAHHERALQQLALEAGTEFLQAERYVHIARILQRRDRPADSIARYRDALDLFARAELTPETELARAECHQRIANLLAINLHDPAGAAQHYQQSIRLYAEYEPFVYGFQASLEMCRASFARIADAANSQTTEQDKS